MANNLRVVYDNAADRATLSASTTAGSLAVTNLLTEVKSEVWRSTANTATLTLTWTTAEQVGMVALPFSSLSSAATIRVRCYTNTSDTTPILDTGTVLANAPSSFGVWGWGTSPLGVNSYSYGGGSYGVVWFDIKTVKKIVVDLADTTNALGYIEASRIVTGSYWSPVNNCEYGVDVTPADDSKHERSDAGDLKTERGCMYKTMSLELNYMPTTDRNTLWNILRGNGMAKPVYLSISPASTDSIEEGIYQIYGKLSRMSGMKYQFMNQFSSQLEIEEM